MRVLHTSAWIEWFLASPTGRLVVDHMPERDEWLVPTIVQLELAKLLKRTAGDRAADQVVAFSNLCVVVSLDT